MEIGLIEFQGAAIVVKFLGVQWYGACLEFPPM